MKFTCEKSALSEAVMSAMRAVSLKSTIEALEGILVAAENGAVSVTGYDLESGICTTIEAAVEQEGRVVLGARTLSEMVRKLPEGDVSVYTDDKLVTQIRCGLSESSLMGIDAGEYPDLPQVQGKATLKLSFEALRNIVRRTAFAVAVTDARPILTGVLLTARGDGITAVAVDRVPPRPRQGKAARRACRTGERRRARQEHERDRQDHPRDGRGADARFVRQAPAHVPRKRHVRLPPARGRLYQL